MGRSYKYDLNILERVPWLQCGLRKRLGDPCLEVFRNRRTCELEVWRVDPRMGMPFMIKAAILDPLTFYGYMVNLLKSKDAWTRGVKEMKREILRRYGKEEEARERDLSNKTEDVMREIRPEVAKIAWEMPARNVPKKALPRPSNLDEVPASEWYS